MSYKPNDPRAKLGRQLLKNLGERETEERRTAPRFLAPVLDVLIDRQVYKTIDWGLGALVIKDFDKTVAIGTTSGVAERSRAMRLSDDSGAAIDTFAPATGWPSLVMIVPVMAAVAGSANRAAARTAAKDLWRMA